MKTRIALWLGIGASFVAASGFAQTGIVNGTFESWNLIGWTLQADLGERATEPFTRPAGAARTVASWGEPFGLSPALGPVQGFRFLSLSTRANANFISAGPYDIFLNQTLSLNQGEIVSGWSYFFNGDVEPLDSAWVRIRDDQNNVVGAPWLETSGLPLTTTANAPVPGGWTQWQWAVPTTGTYSIQLGMSTSGANNNASYGFFDGLTVQAAPIPEPTSMVLAMLGGMALVVLRNRNR